MATSKNDRFRIPYINMIIRAFGEHFQLSVQQACSYLYRCKGIHYLVDHYDVEHTLPVEDTIEALASVCRRGCGFYLTDIQKQAKHMARRKFDAFGGGMVVQEYFFDDQLLVNGSLAVLKFDKVSVEWAQFIYKNRSRQLHFHHSYDVVIGPVADDGVAFLMSQFQHGYINEVAFAEQLKYKQLSNQYCFLTPKAIKTLKRL